RRRPVGESLAEEGGAVVSLVGGGDFCQQGADLWLREGEFAAHSAEKSDALSCVSVADGIGEDEAQPGQFGYRQTGCLSPGDIRELRQGGGLACAVADLLVDGEGACELLACLGVLPLVQVDGGQLMPGG